MQEINKFFIDLLEAEKNLPETEKDYVKNQADRINASQKPKPREELSKDRKKNLQLLEELHDYFNFSKNPIHQEKELELLKNLKTSLEKQEKGYKDKANLIEQLIINVDYIRLEEQKKAKVILERLKEQEKMARLERLREQRLEEQKKMKVRLERLDEQKKMALELEEVARQTLIQKQKPEDLQQRPEEKADGAEKERLNEQKAKMAENKAAAQTSINKASSPTLRDENPTNKTPSTSLRMILNSVLKVTPLLSPFLLIRSR